MQTRWDAVSAAKDQRKWKTIKRESWFISVCRVGHSSPAVWTYRLSCSRDILNDRQDINGRNRPIVIQTTTFRWIVHQELMQVPKRMAFRRPAKKQDRGLMLVCHRIEQRQRWLDSQPQRLLRGLKLVGIENSIAIGENRHPHCARRHT
jgi:hypothetical protein